MLVPTTVTIRPGPVNDMKPPPPDERALSAEPVTDPLIVAPLTLVGVGVNPDNGVGPDGDEDEQALALSPIAMSEMKTSSLLGCKSSLRMIKKLASGHSNASAIPPQSSTDL
jgi:hypothetical protein